MSKRYSSYDLAVSKSKPKIGRVPEVQQKKRLWRALILDMQGAKSKSFPELPQLPLPPLD